MKKMRLMLAAAVLATVAGSFAGSSAEDCDPFGGCENNTNGSADYGNTSCGTGTTPVPNVGEVKADASKGVYVCNDGGTVLSNNPTGQKVEGRIFVYKGPNNSLHVVVDGDDRDNSGGAKGWDRLDVNSGKAACFRRGSAGQAWNTGGSSDTPDAPPNQQNGNAAICTPA